MKTSFTFFILFFSHFSFSQSAFSLFRKLSRPEKLWVFAHPFQAKRALITTRAVLSDVDSIKKTNLIGTDLNGGKLDAFKHAYWMASLTMKIGKKKALKLGNAHEKGNFIDYKLHRLEDHILPDSVSSVMDRENNFKGADVVRKCERISKIDVQKRIRDLLNNGSLKIIRKDKSGNYLYCDGTFIDTNTWKGRWNIPKCLIASNSN
jgi:hypothetical protein